MDIEEIPLHMYPINNTTMKNITQWKPLGELDRFFEDSLSPLFPRIGLDLAVDLYEEEGNVVARMSLPGVKPEELDITIEDDVLSITGRREEEQETDKKDYYSKEIRRGSFSRVVSLPKMVDAQHVLATYRDGVLTVQMPIVEGSVDKAVKVKVS